jgi:cytochrome c-type biogenesis protein
MEVGLVTAFLAGLVSFFAPCMVPLLPSFVSYISGVSVGDLRRENGFGEFRRKVLASSLVYVLGFSLVFVVLGTTAAGLGSVILVNSGVISVLGGILIMIMALQFLGWVKIPWMSGDHRLKLPVGYSTLGFLRTFLVGVIFAVAWTPCVGAVLGIILTLAATSQTAFVGAGLLFVYSLGISLPFILFALAFSGSSKFILWIMKYLERVKLISGVFLLLIGFLLFNNSLGLISEILTYDRLNQVLFDVAFRFGYQIR